MLTAMLVQDFQSPTAASTLTGPQESKTTIFPKERTVKNKFVPRSTTPASWNEDTHIKGRKQNTVKNNFASESTTPTSPKESTHNKGRKQLVPRDPKHRLHQKKRALQKLISCLEVNKTDFTKKCTAKQTCLGGPQHQLHTDESTHSTGKQNSCLGVQRDRLHHRRALQNISASR